MDQQEAPVRAAKSYWVADLVIGVAATFAAVAVAQAALPDTAAGLFRPQAQVKTGPAQQAALPVDAPDFVYGEPVAGYEVVSPFGLRKLPWEQAGRLHAGVDIAAPSGYPVTAAADGVVTRAGYRGGYGQVIEIRHAQGLTSVYGHLGIIGEGVKPGMAVKLGDPIAQVGNTGNSTGAHLHFEMRDRRDRPMNPEMFIDRQYAKLRDLPLREALRVPKGIRIAYVSYIPKMKRALMEAKAAQAAAAKAVAALDGDRGPAKRAAAPEAPYVPPHEAAPPSWKAEPYKDPYDVGVDMPGWPSSNS